MSEPTDCPSCPFCAFLQRFIHEFEFCGFYDTFSVDENNYYCLDPIQYLSEEIGVLPTIESIVAVKNYNQLLMCHEMLTCHLRHDHNYELPVVWIWRFSSDWKLRLKYFLGERDLLMPSVHCVDSDLIDISYDRSNIADCNYYIEPINQVAANCVMV